MSGLSERQIEEIVLHVPNCRYGCIARESALAPTTEPEGT